ncbi:unnamed protein product [Durusdinium trenchii]|uniref:Uncharacterized protein n=2 Tax=Durusdinium trenchii TaxID=1381693 RepID=A0ABP0P4F5_9DINO
MEAADFAGRLQLLEAQVGDLQRRLESVSREKVPEAAPDVQKRLQSLEESMNLQRSSNDERLKVLSSELQQNTKTVMHQLEQHLSTIEEATKQQSLHTESTLKNLAKKVEDSLQNAALEISDAALQNLLNQAEKMKRPRPMPFEHRVVRQVSNEPWQGAGGAGIRSMSPAVVRGMTPVMSVPALRAGMPNSPSTASLRALSPETMVAMALQSPRGDIARGRSSEPMMRGPVRPDAPRPTLVNVPQLSGAASPPFGRLQSSPRGVPPTWLQRAPAALVPRG